jgi:hypothetical protein
MSKFKDVFKNLRLEKAEQGEEKIKTHEYSIVALTCLSALQLILLFAIYRKFGNVSKRLAAKASPLDWEESVT